MNKILQNSQIRRPGVRRQSFREESWVRSNPRVFFDRINKNPGGTPGFAGGWQQEMSPAIFRDENLGVQIAEIVESDAQCRVIPVPPLQIIHLPAQFRREAFPD